MQKYCLYIVSSLLVVGCGDVGSMEGLDTENQKPLSQDTVDTEAALLTRGTDVVAKGDIACGKSDQGQWFCWGRNRDSIPGMALPSGNGDTFTPRPMLPILGLPGEASSMVLGKRHACALVGTKAFCWGVLPGNENTAVGSNSGSVYPLQIEGNYIQLTAGDDFTCGLEPLTSDHNGLGRVVCWGANDVGQLGQGDFATYRNPLKPYPVKGDMYFPQDQHLHSVARVVAGSKHVCALRETYNNRRVALYCWGANDLGQTGLGQEEGDAVNVPKIVTFPPSTFADGTEVELVRNTNSPRHTNLSAYENKTCLVARNPNIYCWGDNRDGTIGFEHPDRTTILYKPTHLDFWYMNAALPQTIAVGKRHICTASYAQVRSPVSGNPSEPHYAGVRCWGDTSFGRLGDGRPWPAYDNRLGTCTANGICYTRLDESMPGTVNSITVGDDFTCLSTEKKEDSKTTPNILCFGQNSQGQLGRGTSNEASDKPEIVLLPRKPAPAAVTSIGLGATTSCATLANGELKCFGANQKRMLGFPEEQDYALVPTMAVPGLNVTQAAKPGLSHQCVVAQEGSVYCWGNNAAGQLGNGWLADTTLPPSQVFGLPAPAVEVVNGSEFSCARLNNGDVYCWGQNNQGQLGRGHVNTGDVSPAKVPTLSSVKNLAAGDATACAIQTQAGTDVVMCWGNAVDGATGNVLGSPMVPTVTPVQIQGVTKPVQLSGAGNRFCSTTASGVVVCWGANRGGNLTGNTALTAPGLAATQVVGINQPVTEVSVGLDNACAKTMQGTMFCWGDGMSMQARQLRMLVSRPVQMFMDQGGKIPLRVSRIAAGNGACAVTTDRKLVCWGEQSMGRLGTGIVQTMLASFQRNNALFIGVDPWLVGENRSPATVEFLYSRPVAANSTEMNQVEPEAPQE